MNKDKTEATWIGALKKSRKIIGEIKWSVEPIKVLGVYVGYDKDKCDKLNWEPKLEKLQNTFHSWKMRYLTPFGKIQIIKSLGLSNLLYLAAVLNVPVDVAKRVDKLIYDFLDCRKYKIKRGVLMSPIVQGGINLPSFSELALALKFSWYRKLFDNSSAKWRNFFSFHFQTDKDWGIL